MAGNPGRCEGIKGALILNESMRIGAARSIGYTIEVSIKLQGGMA